MCKKYERRRQDRLHSIVEYSFHSSRSLEEAVGQGHIIADGIRFDK